MTLPFADPCDVCGQHHEGAKIHYPIRGGRWWLLTFEHYDVLNQTYAGQRYQGVARVALDDELLKARAWLDANPRNLKTDRGMGMFLVHWLNRAIERAEARGTKT